MAQQDLLSFNDRFESQGTISQSVLDSRIAGILVVHPAHVVLQSWLFSILMYQSQRNL